MVMTEEIKARWRVTWWNGSTDMPFDDIGPCTSVEAAEWVVNEIRTGGTNHDMFSLVQQPD
jgi:hypothetical protein